MTMVTIIREKGNASGDAFRASSHDQESFGATPGAALDELTRRLGQDTTGALVVIQDFRPDEFFSEAQQSRLKELMSRSHTAGAGGTPLSENEQKELDALVDAELDASAQRAAALARKLQP